MKEEAEFTGRSVAERIRNTLGRLTASERRPALTLLESYPVAGLETVAQFARRAGVSGPTILRLTAKLGFDSYAGFQQALRDELESRLQAPLSKAPVASTRAEGRDFIGDYTEAIVGNIQTSMAQIPRAEFEAAAGLLGDEKRRVVTIGGRFTHSLAQHLYLHLRELRPRVALVGDQTATWPEHLLDLARNDVLVVFDIRRFQDDVVQFAKQAAAGGTHVILFTDTWVSPVAAVATHVFAVETALPSSWESFGAMMALSEALIARVHAERWGSAKSRMERLEQIRRNLFRAEGQ
ncbi:MurR/RpiR family transcriptional regulator [Acidimangrovimonas sediminis]|uniref:MurR/RpiR family transcriptional regulator n=1 Tax=Acidimangrovimonas sediminis TaxID=2056283 RepID=UPI001304BD4F|nr:MurR/RpiR family transcriptional regulator [Acidimangrovimonas sediminis]